MRPGKVNVEAEYVARLEYGSEFVEVLRDYAVKNKVKSAVFTVIGAVESATLGFYDQKGKKYVNVEYNEPMEVVSCIGNICLMDGEPVVHAHVCLGFRDGRTVGGHLVSMRMFAGELHLRSFKEEMTRSCDKTTGLNLIDFGQVLENNL